MVKLNPRFSQYNISKENYINSWRIVNTSDLTSGELKNFI